MTVFIFGNPDLPEDATPVRIARRLAERFPEHRFEVKDPIEEFDAPEDLVVIDTVAGISAPAVFKGMSSFYGAPRLTAHDFDAYAHLRLLEKLGKAKNVTVIGLPPGMDDDGAFNASVAALSALGSAG